MGNSGQGKVAGLRREQLSKALGAIAEHLGFAPNAVGKQPKHLINLFIFYLFGCTRS